MKEKKHNPLSNTVFAIAWYFKLSPAYTVWLLFSAVVGDVITFFEHTYLSAHILSCVENGRPLSEILKVLIPIAVLVGLKVTVNPLVSAYVAPKFDEKFKKAVHLKLYDKAVQLEIAKYDNSEFYNDFVWAMQQAPKHITDTVITLCRMLSRITVAIVAGTYIVSLDSVTLVAAAIIVPVCFFTSKAVNKLFIKREEELVPIRRKRDYVNRVFYLVDFVKDIKQSEISQALEKDFEESSNQLKEPLQRYGKKITWLNVVNGSTQSLVWDGGFLIYLFYQVLVKSKFALGELFGLYHSGNRLIGNLRQLTRIFPDLQSHSLYIEKLRTFLETENEMPDRGGMRLPESGGIVLDTVRFTYPGNEESAIDGVSLTIKRGEKIALVGFNGAGKTTLIKLILRLYDVTGGAIRYGGYNITEYPLKEYRKQFGVLFQDFEMIAADISQNITMSQRELHTEKADAILKKVGFWERFKTLEKGYKTQLTKEFYEDGIQLSGGEAQKIALARVLYLAHDIIILDEPSSALDPIAEYKLNKAVTELSKDKTVIIISHRLSTTRFVDKIYMLEKGRVIESGKHEHLLQLNGKYAEMFNLQAEKYVL